MENTAPWAKKRFRYAMIVRLEDLKIEPSMARDLYAEIWTDGLLGTITDTESNSKWYVFRKAEQRDRAVKTARKIGLEAAGPRQDPVFISEGDLQERTKYLYSKRYKR